MLVVGQVVGDQLCTHIEVLGADQAPVILVETDPAVDVAGHLVAVETLRAVPDQMILHNQLSTDGATQAFMLLARQMVVHVLHPLGGRITCFAKICNLSFEISEKWFCICELL